VDAMLRRRRHTSPHFSQQVWKGGLQPRRYKAFVTIPVSRAPRTLRRQAARGTGPTGGGSGDFGGAEAPPFRQPLRASKRGEKFGLGPRRPGQFVCSRRSHLTVTNINPCIFYNIPALTG
jgi:hypothetical protein